MYHELDASTIAIFDTKNLLAQCGDTLNHNDIENYLYLIKKLNSDKVFVVNNQNFKITDSKNKSCTAVIAPLLINDVTLGSILFAYQNKQNISHSRLELITGISELLSMQLNIAESQQQQQLMNEAKIRVLLSEDIIHFIANAMSAVNTLIRTDKNKARQMINWITGYIKKGLNNNSTNWTSISDELAYIKNYLTIHSETYPSEIDVKYSIDNTCLNYRIPPLIIMSLIDNAIKYRTKKIKLRIEIMSVLDNISISVSDNGIGIAADKIEQLTKKRVASVKGTGLGLYNINYLLFLMFGSDASIAIQSTENIGTTVVLSIPKLKISRESCNDITMLNY